MIGARLEVFVAVAAAFDMQQEAPRQHLHTCAARLQRSPTTRTQSHLPTATMSDYGGGDDGGFGDDGYEYVHGLSCAAQLTPGAQGEQMTQTLARADTRQRRGHRLR